MSEEMTLKSTITEAEGKWTGAWLRHRSIALMILAQLISSLMAVAAKLLQTASKECGALDTSQVYTRRQWPGIGSSGLILTRFSS